MPLWKRFAGKIVNAARTRGRDSLRLNRSQISDERVDLFRRAALDRRVGLLRLDAHAIAKMIRDLKEQIERKIMEYLQDENLPPGEIVAGLTDINGKAVTGTFHDFLDGFTVVKKRKYNT